MAGISLSQIGSSGIQSGLEQAQQAALDIASQGTGEAEGASNLSDLAQSSVDLLEAQNQVQASARVIATADENLGTIIDTLA